MPYRSEWVDPEVLVEHNGVKVYHTYKDDEFDNGPSMAYFTFKDDFAQGEAEFDVRELPAFNEIVVPQRPPYIHSHDDPVPEGYERKSIELEARWENFRRGERDLLIRTIILALDRGEIAPPKAA